MKNCLVTKLKASVDNDSLLKLGEGVFLAKYSSSAWYIFSVYTAEVPKGIVTVTGATVKSGGEKIDANHFYAGYTLNGAVNLENASAGAIVKFSVDNKYNLSKITSAPLNGFADVKYCHLVEFFLTPALIPFDNIESLNLDEMQGWVNPLELTKFNVDLNNLNAANYLYGDIANLAQFTNLTELVIVQSNISGNIASLAPLVNLTTLQFNKNANITGNIASLGTLVNLTTLNSFNTNLIGSIEGFVQAQRTAGRTTESTGITIPYGLGSGVTFNGNLIGNALNRVLTWTASTITFDGVTIDA